MGFFSLRSDSLLMTVSIATCCFLAWAIAVVPRHRWRRWRAWLQQLIAVLLSAVLVVLLCFVAFNRSSVWYSDWNDLFGFLSNKQAEQDVIGGASESMPTPEPSATPTSAFSQAQLHPEKNPAFGGNLVQDAPRGQWVKVQVGDQGERGDSHMYVWLPPNYMKNLDETYPVIMAFPGYPGTPTSYADPLHFDDAVVAAVAAKTIREPIVVVPNVFPNNIDTECTNVKGAAVETWVTDQVVPWLRQNLRVSQGAEAFTTIGYSAGAYCSSMFPMRHPDLFGSAMSMSGYYEPSFQSGMKAGAEYNLGHVAATQKPAVKIWNYSGKGDAQLRESFDRFLPNVSAPTSVTSVAIPGSSHRWPVWREAQAQGLVWLGSSVEAFAPKG